MEIPVTTELYNVSPVVNDSDNGQQFDNNYGNYEIAKNVLQRYIVPFIILTGVVGNIICFAVFVASPLKRISTSVYLAALAFADTGFLVCLGIGWLESFSVRLFHKEGICQITVYASFLFSFTSIWFVNAFTLEMYITVFHPTKSPKWCQPKTARRCVCILTVVAALIYIYAFWIAKLVPIPTTNEMICVIIPEDAKTAMIFSVFDTILTLVVPFTMIMFMITRLFCHISKFYKTELESSTQSTTISEPIQGESEDQEEDNKISATRIPIMRQANEAQTKLTWMLVVTVIVFLVLNLPSHAIKFQFLFRSLLSEHVEFTETEGFMQVIFQILYYANFSINFILYSACGKSFRGAMTRMYAVLWVGNCKRRILDINIKKLALKRKKSGVEADNNQNTDEEQHSRLVDIHLKEIRFSQLPSIDSQFMCKSPPCLLALESEQILEE